MKNEVKIIQLIPAPVGMRAVHEFENEVCEVPIVALALAEEPGMCRYVVALEMQSDGEILIAENKPSFMFILFGGEHLEQEVTALEQPKQIGTVLEEIQSLREDLADLLDNPSVTLERMRGTLEEIKELQEDVEA